MTFDPPEDASGDTPQDDTPDRGAPQAFGPRRYVTHADTPSDDTPSADTAPEGTSPNDTPNDTHTATTDTLAGDTAPADTTRSHAPPGGTSEGGSRPRLPPQLPIGDLTIKGTSVAGPDDAVAPAKERRRDASKPKQTTTKSKKQSLRPHAHRPTGSTGGEFLRALLFPGLTTVRRAFVLGSLLVLIGIIFPLFVVGWIVFERNDLLALALDNRFLLAVTVGSVAAVLARFVAVTEVAMFRGRHEAITLEAIAAYLLLVLIAVPIGWGVYQTDQARQSFDDIFSTRAPAPLYVTPAGWSDQFTTVLFLGSDGGPDRFGHRTDSMILVTVHRESGRTALLSVPRNLVGLQFPPATAMAGRFPGGFDDLANAVYPYVAGDPAVQADFAVGGLPPAEVAVAQAIGHSLGIQIDDFVFVDMAGFVEVIDALGGVTVEVEGEVPLPPNIVGAKREIPPTVGPGLVEMDGTLAIAYARARSTDSDYARMGRQRQILSALADQTSIVRAVTRLTDVAEALSESVRTSTSRDGFASLSRSVSDSQRVVESVGLVPPLIQPGSPDYARIREIVAEVQQSLVTGEPSGYTPEPAPAPAD